MKMNKLTVAILISMLLGILTGQGYRLFAADQAADFANNITILTDIFLRLIKMIIAPLVFTTLVVGIAKMGDTRTVGRIGAKTLGWFNAGLPDVPEPGSGDGDPDAAGCGSLALPAQ